MEEPCGIGGGSQVTSERGSPFVGMKIRGRRTGGEDSLGKM